MQNKITFEKRISSWLPVIRRKVLGYLRNANNVDDVTQDIALKLLQTKAMPENPSSGWLSTVIHNAIVDFCRNQSKENKYIDSNWMVDSLGLRYDPSEDEMYCQAIVCEDRLEPDFISEAERTLATMSKPIRQALMLYANGHTYMEIAELTGAKVGTVRSRLHNARKKTGMLLGAYR